MNIDNYPVIEEQALLTATQLMKILNISRALFYTKIIIDEDFVRLVRPVCLIEGGLKQYKYSDLMKFIDAKQQKTAQSG